MNNSCEIINIEADSEQVKIDFRYTNNNGYGGWARIDPKCFIRPVGTNTNLIMIKAEGMPMSPETLSFKKDGDILHYTLFFPPLPENVTAIDIIEDEKDTNSFNFYNISLLNQKLTMTKNEIPVLKKIEALAFELKNDSKIQKSYFEEVERLNGALNELANFLKLSNEETAVLCIAIYISISTESFCLTEIKKHTNFCPFDFYEIKSIIKGLEKKGWIDKCGSVGMHRGPKRMEEKIYSIASSVLESLFKNETPTIKKKEMDVYLLSDTLHKCLRGYVDYEINLDEMQTTIAEFEEEHRLINPFKVANELNLNQTERLMFYYMITKTTIGEDVIDVDRMVANFFKSHHEKIIIKKMLSNKESKLFSQNIIEFAKEDFKTDKQIKLTDDAIKRIFGEDACFFSREDGFSSGICKLIKCDSIIQKELFYNENEQQSINTVSEFLKTEKFSEIVKRLEENKMRPGLTILLHGYPGTGKTETIYQLAKQTNRNILLVNISEIKDKWVGESEKRLKAVFETYKNSFKHFDQVPILLFNESDALIGKRINVNTSVDQMNNAMQNILLQELEDFKGILMATTNLTANLDEAFERRFLFKVKYSRPSTEAKKSIWKSKLNFLSEEDAVRLADEFDFSGGQIENISRKLFLNTILLGKSYSLEDTIQYCTDEILLDQNKKKIGF